MATISTRRTILRRGLAALTALLGLGVGKGASAAGASPGRRNDQTLRFYGERRPSPCGTSAGTADPRTVAHGVLLDRPDGDVVGEFHVHALGSVGSFGVPVRSAATLEIQMLQLADGMLLAMGAPAAIGGADHVHAIIGGTGRFSGASGSCRERVSSTNACGRTSVEFILTLRSEVPHAV